MLDSIERFIVSWRFPVMMISVLLFTVALMVGILVLPPSLGALSEFAQDFKVWCFGYDPLTGSLEWAYVVMLTVQPLIILVVVVLIWQGPLRDIVRTKPSAIVSPVLLSLAFVAVFAVSLPLLGNSGSVNDAGYAFPGERLRTSRSAVGFSLTDQHGAPLEFGDMTGRVVLVTAVYASCGDTCPMILQQTKRVLESLNQTEREDLTVVAITLDPEVDTPEIMNALLTAHGLASYEFRGGTGDPAYVNSLLDAYGFARIKDPGTGMIQHANKLVAIDRDGRVAFTFSLGDIQEQWLTEGLRMLLSEKSPA